MGGQAVGGKLRLWVWRFGHPWNARTFRADVIRDRSA